MNVKLQVEQFILWKTGKGNVSFWQDNQTTKGALANLINFNNAPRNAKIYDFFNDTGWNIPKIRELPNYLSNDIKDIQIHLNKDD